MVSGRRSSIDETTASEACADAPNQAVAKQVEEAANLEHEAAEHAASVAKELGPKYTGESVSAVGRLGMEASQVLSQAVEEGKRDVTGAAGVESSIGHIKETAEKVPPVAQEHLSFTDSQAQGENTGSDPAVAAGSTQESIMEMLKNIADSGRTTIRKTGEAVTDKTQKVFGTAGTEGAQLVDMPASSTGIPAVTGPLQSGTKNVDTMYPAAGAGHEAKDIAQNEPRKSSM